MESSYSQAGIPPSPPYVANKHFRYRQWYHLAVSPLFSGCFITTKVLNDGQAVIPCGSLDSQLAFGHVAVPLGALSDGAFSTRSCTLLLECGTFAVGTTRCRTEDAAISSLSAKTRSRSN